MAYVRNMYGRGEGRVMSYQDPGQVKSPKGAVTHLKVIYDGGAQGGSGDEWEGWSIAELEWHEQPTLACRWNGGNGGGSGLGNPQSRGLPTWFIIPKPLHAAIRARVRNALREQGLARAAAALSAPAFAEIWSNPEDDVYDAV
jgi:hypothetical protein